MRLRADIRFGAVRHWGCHSHWTRWPNGWKAGSRRQVIIGNDICDNSSTCSQVTVTVSLWQFVSNCLKPTDSIKPNRPNPTLAFWHWPAPNHLSLSFRCVQLTRRHMRVTYALRSKNSATPELCLHMVLAAPLDSAKQHSQSPSVHGPLANRIGKKSEYVNSLWTPGYKKPDHWIIHWPQTRHLNSS